MEVKIKKLYENSLIPSKAHETDAGFDLYVANKEVDGNGNMVYGSGVAMEIPKGYVGLVFPRSSVANKGIILTNCVGVIDSCYRGEIMCKFKPVPSFCAYEEWVQDFNEPMVRTYEIGDRFAQIIIMPYPEITFKEVSELAESERGTGGYGSSGK